MFIYKHLVKKYKIHRGVYSKNEMNESEIIDYDDYDLVYVYTHYKNSYVCHILKNNTDLIPKALALIMDYGSLAFGYKIDKNGDYIIYKNAIEYVARRNRRINRNLDKRRFQD